MALTRKEHVSTVKLPLTRLGGDIVRRSRPKIYRSQECAGSSPAPGTKKPLIIQRQSFAI